MGDKRSKFVIPSPADDAASIACMFKKIQEGFKKYQEKQEQGPQWAPAKAKGAPKASMGRKLPEKKTLFESHLKTPTAIPSHCESRTGGSQVVSNYFPSSSAHSRRIIDDLRDNRYYEGKFLPKKPEVTPLTFDEPTFGQNFFCSNVRDAQDTFSKPGKRKGIDDNDSGASAVGTSSSAPYQNNYCGGYGFSYHQPTKEEVDDFVAFADKWIPSVKRRKTENDDSSGGAAKSAEEDK